MVNLLKNDRYTNRPLHYHNVKLVHMGRNVLTHGNISGSIHFKNRLAVGSNAAANKYRKPFITYIQNIYRVKGVPLNKQSVINMAEHIINLRKANQVRFVQEHERTAGEYQELKRRLDIEMSRSILDLARVNSQFKSLLNLIRNNPNRNNLKERRNARLGENREIRAIRREKERLRQRMIQLTKNTTEHARQIAAWRWFRNQVASHLTT